ncbi:type II secretion system F family protein [Rhodococcus sp. G-MC3]|uniref:type II secretion system F family protein n=1 Tax=Rhodococcus sp. G-MC3 TaxID=3046209 RepID=UPI0024BB575E|nr:type II secretion system F family protein [Rhodococcus sp. G-MC3]MDJ0393511.1 type II secretion system F family protein [Rhodococcus sp. G-MC3]
MMWEAFVCAAVALILNPSGPEPFRRLNRDHEPTSPSTSVPDIDPLAVATTFDMMAACLRGGLPTSTAASAVSATAPGGSAVALRTTADLLALGADPEIAWAPVAASEELEPLARMARRSARSGASLADAVSELADTERSRVEDSAAAAAERAGVLISGPLGLCFLPAFVCLGIVPVVAGLADNVLGGGLL